jgi:hypothetical protein
LLTEFFPPIESARQESNRAHGSLERAHARPSMMNAQRNRGMYLRVGERLAAIRTQYNSEEKEVSHTNLAEGPKCGLSQRR